MELIKYSQSVYNLLEKLEEIKGYFDTKTNDPLNNVYFHGDTIRCGDYEYDGDVFYWEDEYVYHQRSYKLKYSDDIISKLYVEIFEGNHTFIRRQYVYYFDSDGILVKRKAQKYCNGMIYKSIMIATPDPEYNSESEY